MKKPVQDADLALFRAEVADAKPIRQEQAEPYRQRPRPVPRPRPVETDPNEETGLSEHEVETPEYLLYARPGIQHRVMGQLQRGEIAVGLEVDLHGLTSEHAHACLREFLTECRERRIRCARIIHGKGSRSQGRQPVLKCKVNYWLRLRRDVLAFCSAPRRDGGTGAVYVLLRNPDKNDRRRGRSGRPVGRD